MKTLIYTLLIFLGSTLPQAAIAHPGHGESHGALHLEHVLVIGAGLILAALVSIIIRDR